VVFGVPSPGEDEDALAAVRGSRLGRGETVPLRIEPERGEIMEDDVEAASSEGGDVLDEDVAGLDFVDDAGVLGPEAGAGSADSGLLTGI
jgi:hypothetical protein